MKKKTLTSLISLLFAALPLAKAQLHDNGWLFGYSNNADTTDKFGIVLLNFDKGRPIARQIPELNFNYSCGNLQDTLQFGGILTATRHANGRDWWVIVNEYRTNRYHRVLIHPRGATVVGTQTVGSRLQLGVGQVAFSPDGRHFANYYAIDDAEGVRLEVYDFDRW